MSSFERAAGTINSIKYDSLGEIWFNEEICDKFDTLVTVWPYARELAKRILSESLIPLPQLEKLGRILKEFENEQPKEARKLINLNEKLIEKSIGKLEI